MAFILFIFGLIIYFIPAMVAKGKPQSMQVFLVNLFLGWTLVGWVLALVWAINESDEPQTPTVNVNLVNPEAVPQQINQSYPDAMVLQSSKPKPDPTPNSLPEQLARLAELHRQGLLTDAEFERAKAQVLGG